MPDIFISYSSKDREQAELLTELLASAGLSVWIDKAGIGAATSWSGEISKAISDCKALIVLLSPSSVDSKNVTREVALAFERNKKILPIDIEPVTLPDDFAYHLAGIQRAPMTNIDTIIRALGKLGLEATGAPQAPRIVKETDERKSLMILPFEDLSPTGDNGWFADGIATELIGALSQVKSLRVADQQTTKDYKRYSGTLPAYAKEAEIRYFVQGSVRKFGDQIKIAVSLLDIETGDHLWQDSMKGTMNDVFEIQEEVAKKVTDGLHIILTSEEKKKLEERGTENAEAYELLLKSTEYFARNTHEGLRLAIQLITEAIDLDPRYAKAYSYKANDLTALYRNYERDPKLLDEAEALAKEALRLNPEMFDAYYPLSMVYMHSGNLDKAEQAAKEFIRKAPDNPISHFALGFFYTETGQYAKAIVPYEEAARLKPDNRIGLINIVIACHAAKEIERTRQWSSVALPLYERYIKLHPDDESSRSWYAVLLFYNGRPEEARREAMSLMNVKDGATLFSTACLWGMIRDSKEALATFRKAIEAGFKNIHYLNEFLNDEDEGIAELRGTPEYEEVKRMVEQIELEAKTHA